MTYAKSVTLAFTRKDLKLQPWDPKLHSGRPQFGCVVLRSGFGKKGIRVLIEQPGHPVPDELAKLLGARIRPLKNRNS